MSLLLVIVVIGVSLTLAAAGAWWLYGPERIWELFGPADLGHVEFEALQRRPTPTDALACPSGFCPVDSDILVPTYPVDVAMLRKAMARALMTERRLTLVAIDDRTPQDRFIQRSEGLRFPDTIDVRYITLPTGRTTIAIYSRSQLGRNDLGVNVARAERWLKKLSREVSQLRSEAKLTVS